MKRFIVGLTAVMLIVMGSTAFSLEFNTVNLGNVNNQTKVYTNLDSQQPDTIQYDGGSGQYFLTGAVNWWGTVRFTCPANFTLNSVYVQGLNPYNNQAGCDVYIHADNAGQPGAVLGGPYHINGPMVSYVFSDAEVVPGLDFDEGDDFHVVYGPAPGGPNSSPNGWYLYLDGNGNTNSRSGMANNRFGPWDRSLPGDLMVRAGGELESFVDIACNSTYTTPAVWFVPAGTTMSVSAEVENVGTDPISAYTIVWTARNAGGTMVWTETGNYGALAVGASIVRTAASQYTPNTTGYYEIEAHATCVGDANTENDIFLMEQGVGALGFDWMKYDDGTMESQIQFSAGNGWGQRFDPVSYPAKVESVMVGVGGPSTVSDIRIFHYDPTLQQFEEIWSYTGAIVQDWNTISLVSDNVVIFDGAFVLVYLYQEGASMEKDDTPPIAAANLNMAWSACQVSGYGSTFYEETSGDWALRIYADSSSAVPPEPVVETSADTLYFGNVTINTTVQQSVWVKNVGGGDTLYVTNIMFTPLAVDSAYNATPAIFALARFDSQEVVVTFNPHFAHAYNGTMGILNNTTPPVYPVRVFGTGTTASVNEPKYEGMPETFSLSQNYPNPFNPSTEIRFGLPVMSKVSLDIYNVMGQRIVVLANETFEAGYHSVTWDASNMPSGIYFYRLEAGTYTDLKKMVLIK